MENVFSLDVSTGGIKVGLGDMWSSVDLPAPAYLPSSTYRHLLLTCHLNKQCFYRALAEASLQLPALRLSGCFVSV